MCSKAFERSILARMKGLIVERLGRLADRADVGAALDERLADRVDPFLGGEFQTLVIALGEGADPQADAGEVEPLARSQFAAVHHLAGDVVSGDGEHFELDDAVVQVKSIAAPDHLGESLEGDGYPPPVSHDVIGRQHQRIALLQLHRFLLELAYTHLRPGEVGHDRKALARGTGGGAQVGDHLAVTVEGPMGEVEPGHVHPGEQHLLHDLLRCGGRPDGADDLGLVVGQLHRFPPVTRC